MESGANRRGNSPSFSERWRWGSRPIRHSIGDRRDPCLAPTASATDWGRIVGLYDVLLQAEPSPIVELNRAVAVAMRDGPAAGLALIDGPFARGELTTYHLAHAAKADLCRRLRQIDEARRSYERALSLTQQEPERRFWSEGWWSWPAHVPEVGRAVA